MKHGSQSVRYGYPSSSQGTLERVKQLFGQPIPYRKTVNRRGLSAPASDRRPPDTTLALTKTTQKPTPRNLKLSELPKHIQSYKQYRLSCYVTGPMEALYSVYLRHQETWTKAILSLPDSYGLKVIYESFRKRDQASGSSNQIANAINDVGSVEEMGYIRFF
jgi:hypothetical protein